MGRGMLPLAHSRGDGDLGIFETSCGMGIFGIRCWIVSMQLH